MAEERNTRRELLRKLLTLGPAAALAGAFVGNGAKPAQADNFPNVAVLDGSPGAPSYTFQSDLNTGFYRKAEDVLAMVANGQEAGMMSGQTGVGTLAIGNVIPANEKLLITGSGTSDFMRVSSLNDEAGDVFIVKRNGYVGIGTAVPAEELHIKDRASADTEVVLEYGGSGGGTPRTYSVLANSEAKFYIRDRTDVAYRLAIDSAGNVGIGTPSPAYALDVVGSIHLTGVVEGASRKAYYDL